MLEIAACGTPFQHSSEFLLLRTSNVFGTSGGWITDDNFHFWLNYTPQDWSRGAKLSNNTAELLFFARSTLLVITCSNPGQSNKRIRFARYCRARGGQKRVVAHSCRRHIHIQPENPHFHKNVRREAKGTCMFLCSVLQQHMEDYFDVFLMH